MNPTVIKRQQLSDDGTYQVIQEFDNKSILVTGGTGSFGHTFLPMTLERFNLKKVVIYSRDESMPVSTRVSNR